MQEGRLPLGEDSEAALGEGARVASAHLLHAQSTGLTVRHRRQHALRGLLEGDADVTAAADLLGFDATLPCAVLGIALDATGRLGTGTQLLRRVDDLLRARALAFRWLVAGILTEGRLLVLVPELTGPADQVDARIERLAWSVCQDAERAGVAVRIACGPIAGQLAGAATTVTGVDHMLQLLAREPGHGRVATHASARAAVAVSRALEVLASVPELTDGPVTALLDHDLRHGTDYARTLAVWLEHLGDCGLAAHKLDIHPNTVRYRLQRIAQVSGLHLEDPDERLVATLHLRLVAVEALRGGAPSAPSGPG